MKTDDAIFYWIFLPKLCRLEVCKAHEQFVSGPRQQQNHITSYIDLSSVYGSSEDEAEALRAPDGKDKITVVS